MNLFRIERYSFGIIVIDGKTYTDDLIILPDGKILKPWWRQQGHQLTMDDLYKNWKSDGDNILVDEAGGSSAYYLEQSDGNQIERG